MLDGGNKIILVNWPNDKDFICTINNDIPIEIPSHPYVLVNKSILFNCGIEAENSFLIESLAACHNTNTKLIIYFTVNTAFTNYIDQFNVMEELEMPILTKKSTSQFTLPVFLNKSTFDDTLLLTPITLKEYVAQYKHEKENFDLKERHDIDEFDIEFPNKNFLTNNFIIDAFIFITAIISVKTTMIIIYTLYKHNKLRALLMRLALQEVKEVKAEEVKDKNYKCECISQFYVILALSIVIIGLVVFTILQIRRISLCRGQLFLNVVKIMLFISDVQYYVPVKFCKTAGSIHLFQTSGKLMIDKVKLNKHYIWDILEIDWSEVKVTFNGRVISLPELITFNLRDKFKVRNMIGSQPILFHLMLKQGFRWFTLAQEEQEIKNI